MEATTTTNPKRARRAKVADVQPAPEAPVALTVEGLRAIVKRYRAGELEAAGELVALGTDRVDDLARAYGQERATEKALAQLAEAREKKGDDGVARRVALHVESHADGERAHAKAMRLRATRVLCPSRVDGRWTVETGEVAAASDGPGRFALVAFGDDVWTLPRATMRRAPDLLRKTSDVAWEVEAKHPTSPVLVCRYRTGLGSGRLRFALAPISGEDLRDHLPEGESPTEEIRRTFGRPPVEAATVAESYARELEEVYQASADYRAALREEAAAIEAAPAPTLPPTAEPEAAPHVPPTPEPEAPTVAHEAPEYAAGAAAAAGASADFVRGFLDVLAARGVSLPVRARPARVVIPSDELAARRREAARKAVETRRARLAARGPDEAAHFRCVS